MPTGDFRCANCGSYHCRGKCVYGVSATNLKPTFFMETKVPLDKGAKSMLTIERMPEGGFLVYAPRAPGEITERLFASTGIDEALTFIRDQVGGAVSQASNR